MKESAGPHAHRWIFLCLYPFADEIDVVSVSSIHEANARMADARLRGLVHGVFSATSARTIALIRSAGGAVSWVEPMPRGVEEALAAWSDEFDRQIAARSANAERVRRKP